MKTFGTFHAATVVCLLAATTLWAQRQSPFAHHSAACQGPEGRGSAQGPGLANNPRVAEQSQDQLRAYLRQGNVNAGMPSLANLSDADLSALTRFLRRLNVETILMPPVADLAAAKIKIAPPQPGEWRTYNGDDSGNRYSPLKQINTANVADLKLKWVFPMTYFGIETTPLAAGGVLHITGQSDRIDP